MYHFLCICIFLVIILFEIHFVSMLFENYLCFLFFVTIPWCYFPCWKIILLLCNFRLIVIFFWATWSYYLTLYLPLFFFLNLSCFLTLFFPPILRYNWQMTTCKFKVYNVMILIHIYIVKLLMMFVNPSIISHYYNFCLVW